MGTKRFSKEVIYTLILGHLLICIVSFPIFFILPVQSAYSQEIQKITAPPSTLPSKGVSNEHDNTQRVTNPSVPQTTARIAKKRGMRNTTSHIPVFDKNGTIYLASCDGKLSAIDPAGNTRWYLQFADNINTGLAISSDGTLYFSSGKMLYAIGSNGVLKWVFKADNAIDFPSVLDTQGNIYLVTGKDDYVYAVRPDGALYWKAHINGRISIPPSITADGRIYITTKNNILYALNTDGSLRWRRKIHCRQTDALATAAQTSGNSISNTALQYETRPVRESQKQSLSQTPRISNIKPEEIQTASAETDTPANTSFSASVLNGNAPLTLKFSDTSTGKIVSRYWDFGDGTLANAEQSPVHTYAKPGTYDVRLIIKRPDSTSTIARRSYITVTDVFSNGGKEIITDKQGRGNDAPVPLIPNSNIYNDAKLLDSEALASVTNSTRP